MPFLNQKHISSAILFALLVLAILQGSCTKEATLEKEAPKSYDYGRQGTGQENFGDDKSIEEQGAVSMRGRVICDGCDPSRIGITSMSAPDESKQGAMTPYASGDVKPDFAFELKGLPVGKPQVVFGWRLVKSQAFGGPPQEGDFLAFYRGNILTPKSEDVEGVDLWFYKFDLDAWAKPDWRTGESGDGSVSGDVSRAGASDDPVVILAFMRAAPSGNFWLADAPVAGLTLDKPGPYRLEGAPKGKPVYLFAFTRKAGEGYWQVKPNAAPHPSNPMVVPEQGGAAADFFLPDPDKQTYAMGAKEPDNAASPIRFEDVTADSGLSFTHTSGRQVVYMPEAMGPGACAIDADGDGLEDVYLVNSLRAGESAEAGAAETGKLFHNHGGMKFEDVTEASGFAFRFEGMGCAVGDYDADGRDDLYLTGYGANRLLRNAGGGKFAASAAANDPRFSAGASFFDYDNDGDLDLYVANYLDFDYDTTDIKPEAISPDRNHYRPFLNTLRPQYYRGQKNALFQNQKRTFVDMADLAGAAGNAIGEGYSLGVLTADFNDDGWLDVYVANDEGANELYINNGGGTFAEKASEYGLADTRGGMGLTAGDMNIDGKLDVVCSNYAAEANGLYAGAANGRFIDRSAATGVGAASFGDVGWEVGFADFDNDGLQDLFVVNGHAQAADYPEGWENQKLVMMPQPDKLYRNVGGGKFEEVSYLEDAENAPIGAGRGGVLADFDLDGRVDILVANNNGPAQLRRNVTEHSGNWTSIRLTDKKGRRPERAILWDKRGEQMQIPGGGYLSENSSILHFGIGEADSVEKIEIIWPGVESQIIERPEINRLIEVSADDQKEAK